MDFPSLPFSLSGLNDQHSDVIIAFISSTLSACLHPESPIAWETAQRYFKAVNILTIDQEIEKSVLTYYLIKFIKHLSFDHFHIHVIPRFCKQLRKFLAKLDNNITIVNLPRADPLKIGENALHFAFPGIC